MTSRQVATQTAAPPRLELDGARASIELRRPAQANRIEPEDLEVLQGLLDEVERKDALRVLVLRATGKHFSAGFTIGELAGNKTGRAGADSAFEAFVNRVEDLRVVTIAAINGGVYGGSTDLALACDFRVGVPAAEMTMPAARLGVHYYGRGLQRFVSRLGLNAAKKLFLTASRIDAAEMLACGFLTEIVAADRLQARVAELADQIAMLAPIALFGVKRALNEIARGALDAGGLAARIEESARSADLQEGLRAWQEKRPPRFTGN